MIKVTIKARPTLGPAAMAKVGDAIPQALHALGTMTVHNLTRRAQAEMSPFTGQAYIRGLQDAESMTVDKNRLTITLVGKFPVALEKGAPPWDIKAKMLPKGKRSKKGNRYIDVPFEHGAPGTTGKKPMPAPEYRLMQGAVREAKAALGHAPVAVRGPKTMPTRPVAKKVSLPGDLKASYTPKAGPYDSMIGIRQKGTEGRRYITIRRISDTSDPASWIHPGFKARNFFKDAAVEIERVGPKVIKDYLEKL